MEGEIAIDTKLRRSADTTRNRTRRGRTTGARMLGRGVKLPRRGEARTTARRRPQRVLTRRKPRRRNPDTKPRFDGIESSFAAAESLRAVASVGMRAADSPRSGDGGGAAFDGGAASPRSIGQASPVPSSVISNAVAPAPPRHFTRARGQLPVTSTSANDSANANVLSTVADAKIPFRISGMQMMAPGSLSIGDASAIPGAPPASVASAMAPRPRPRAAQWRVRRPRSSSRRPMLRPSISERILGRRALHGVPGFLPSAITPLRPFPSSFFLQCSAQWPLRSSAAGGGRDRRPAPSALARARLCMNLPRAVDLGIAVAQWPLGLLLVDFKLSGRPRRTRPEARLGEDTPPRRRRPRRRAREAARARRHPRRSTCTRARRRTAARSRRARRRRARPLRTRARCPRAARASPCSARAAKRRRRRRRSRTAAWTGGAPGARARRARRHGLAAAHAPELGHIRQRAPHAARRGARVVDPIVRDDVELCAPAATH